MCVRRRLDPVYTTCIPLTLSPCPSRAALYYTFNLGDRWNVQWALVGAYDYDGMRNPPVCHEHLLANP